MHRRCFICCGFSTLLAQPPAQQQGKERSYRIFPVDDTQRSSDFHHFADKLTKVIQHRDASGLRKLTAHDINTGTGRKGDPEEKGWDAFAARWRPGEGDSDVWETLAEILSLGCERIHPNIYVAPYLVWKFPRELNPATHWVIVRDLVPLREAPDRKARELLTLSFDVVEKLPPVPGQDDFWRRVRVNGRMIGFVPAQAVRSPMMPRVQFARKGSDWRIASLESPN